ncbi:LOW QUALITY PROTEIN: zinc finger AN1 domain-containing stress-associated protein 12 [Rhodamnia argentea]|uniref:LOW QUALITY PROTEIN: zinc finger AN1 domain-containing stress-associated protein 12 n=1 Tax=Rhodamnia argentea TaxID=178133 RepID=A0A8B8R525_9MYRT|nr:LOW QUALITY PROTEIN: zinc finger AN1 domain-containing stress-associated protein 12 [Rhodamnia argentea]
MGGGTEAFPDLGRHCQNPDCNLLDFLPFTCDGCRKVFCVEHRSYKSHECPESDHRSRRVVVCEACSAAIETTGEDEKTALERHEGSGDCDPRKKKKKPACPVRRCREVLTFSNTSTCKACGLKVCLRHRFPADHGCGAGGGARSGGRWNEKFMAALASRGAEACGMKERAPSSPPSTPTIKAC